MPVHRESAARNDSRKRACAVPLSVRNGSNARRRPACGFAALALREFRLQPALRLLLRAFVAHGAPTELGLARVQRITREAPGLGVKEIFVTGGEPFLLENIGEILACCASAAPTTVLTNGMLFTGRRAESLRALPRDRVVLQISLDSPTPELHDLHRGRGSWARAHEGIRRARAQGFRVRLAATVSTDAEAEEFRQFLDEEKIAAEDRVIRRVALRGSATEGVALSRADLVPEVTITADGVYWHPVGAQDTDLLVTRDIFPLSEAFAAVRRAFNSEGEHAYKLARIFNCA